MAPRSKTQSDANASKEKQINISSEEGLDTSRETRKSRRISQKRTTTKTTILADDDSKASNVKRKLTSKRKQENCANSKANKKAKDEHLVVDSNTNNPTEEKEFNLSDGLRAPQDETKQRKETKDSASDKMLPATVDCAPVPHGKKFLGAHVSIAGGVHRAVTETLDLGGHAMAMFLCSQRTWTTKPLDAAAASAFRDALAVGGLRADQVLPHGSYLLNCGSPDKAARLKSRALLLDGVRRCEMLGIRLYNFHPGSSKGEISVEECCKNIAECVNSVLKESDGVTLLLETMSGQGNTIGSFKELADIIGLVEDKSRVGVCLDTCHVFAWGHDISSAEGYLPCRPVI